MLCQLRIFEFLKPQCVDLVRIRIAEQAPFGVRAKRQVFEAGHPVFGQQVCIESSEPRCGCAVSGQTLLDTVVDSRPELFARREGGDVLHHDAANRGTMKTAAIQNAIMTSSAARELVQKAETSTVPAAQVA